MPHFKKINRLSPVDLSRDKKNNNFLTDNLFCVIYWHFLKVISFIKVKKKGIYANKNKLKKYVHFLKAVSLDACVAGDD